MLQAGYGYNSRQTIKKRARGASLTNQANQKNFRQDSRIGEVIGADSSTLTVQCYELYQAPPLGALVQAGEPRVIGVVQSVRTEPIDPGRPVLARGQNAGSVEQVYRDNPQIERLLTTRFDALIVGHETEAGFSQLLPPSPPRIHSFVCAWPPGDTRKFTQDLDFLRFLVNSGGPLADEVVVACLREAARYYDDREEFIVRAGRALATELAGDSARLTSLVRRIR